MKDFISMTNDNLYIIMPSKMEVASQHWTDWTDHSGLNRGSGWGWQGNDCQSSGLMLVEPANELY